MSTQVACPKCKAALKLPPRVPPKRSIVPAIVASVVTGFVMFSIGFMIPHGVAQATAPEPQVVVESTPIVDDTKDKQIADLTATVAKLEQSLRESETKLGEAIAQIPSKLTDVERRKKLAKAHWHTEMENFLFMHAGMNENDLPKIKTLQDKCDIVQSQLEMAYRGESVIIDDFTEKEIRFAHLWPFAYATTIFEWQLHKGLPFFKTPQ